MNATIEQLWAQASPLTKQMVIVKCKEDFDLNLSELDFLKMLEEGSEVRKKYLMEGASELVNKCPELIGILKVTAETSRIIGLLGFEIGEAMIEAVKEYEASK